MDYNINYSNLEKHKEDFETYMGIIPMALHSCFSIVNQLEFIKVRDIDLFDEVSGYYVRCRYRRLNEVLTDKDYIEALNWVKNNKLFTDIIEINY